MLFTIAAILLIGWLLGVFAFKVVSLFIHLLLLGAVAVFIARLITGK